jgi:hypothetical protein
VDKLGEIVFVCPDPECVMFMVEISVPCRTELGFTSVDERRLTCECGGRLKNRDELGMELVSPELRRRYREMAA